MSSQGARAKPGAKNKARGGGRGSGGLTLKSARDVDASKSRKVVLTAKDDVGVRYGSGSVTMKPASATGSGSGTTAKQPLLLRSRQDVQFGADSSGPASSSSSA